MEHVVLFVLASGVLSASQDLGSVRVGSRSVDNSFHGGYKSLDPLANSLGGHSVNNPRRNRRVRDASRDRWRDLFGFVEDSYSYGNAPISSYTGSVLPFWTFKTNSDFVYSSKDPAPRERRRARYDGHLQRGVGFRQSSEEDIMEAAGTELVEDEADPEPPKREEEFISEHEKPRDVPTRPKHGVPGGWAKGEVPGKKEVDVGFVPLQIYSQIRRYDSEEHLPRERAAEEADNQEEILAAPRLREVLRNKKLHEVYEEEGYEDLGYDHGGYNHHGIKVEDAVKNEQGAYRKLPPSASDTDSKGTISIKVYSPEQTNIQSPTTIPGTGDKERQDSSAQQSTNLDMANTKVEISGRRILVDGKKGPTLKNTLRDTVKQNLTIYVPDVNIADRMDIAETRSEDTLDPSVTSSGRQKITFPGKATRRHYTNWVNPIVVAPDIYQENESVQKPQMVNVHQVASYVPSPYYHETSPQSAQFSASSPVQFASTINTYASLINQNFTAPLMNEPQWTQSKHQERDIKTDRSDNNSETQLEGEEMEDKIGMIKPEGFSLRRHEESSESPRKQSARQSGRRRGSSSRSSNPDSSSKSTEAITQSVPVTETTTPTLAVNRRTMAPNTKRDKIYSNFTRGNVKYNPEDDSQWTPTVGTLNIRHPSLPIDKNEEKTDGVTKPFNDKMQGESHPPPTQSSPSLVISIPNSNEQTTTKDPSANAKYVEQLTLAHFSAPVNIYSQPSHLMSQDERLKKLAQQLNSPQEEAEESNQQQRKKRSPVVYSKDKYPHYEAPPSISKDSALKYASNPATVPKKSYGGMEFYKSKENIKCNGPHPPKNVTPNKEEDGEWESDPVPDGPRVKGVGLTIDCYKRKFFGKDPLDNPFFKEGDVDSPVKNEDASYIEDKISTGIPDDDKEIRDISEKRKLIVPTNATDSESEEEPVSSENEEYGSSELESTKYSSNSSPSQSKIPSYEKSDEDSPTITTEPLHKHNSYYDKNKSKHPLKNKKMFSQKVIQPIAVYSIFSNNEIPPHHAPLLIPETNPNVPPVSDIQSPVISYAPIDHQNRFPQNVYPIINHYPEKTIIVQKREIGNDFWDAMNPIKWWWPSFYDARRHEPRYRRSTEPKTYDVIISNSDRTELAGQGSEVVEVPLDIKTSTNSPITLAEFKAKFNIPDAKKSETSRKPVASRLTGGFLNRNSDITDHIELFDGQPTEPSTGSTVATTTVKPKVIFPRAKLPRRKTYSTKKPPTFSPNVTTEATTTTTTTTIPPPTTTRMYKPKRVIQKNYGKGPFDAFTILKHQREATTPGSFENSEMSNRSDDSEGHTSKMVHRIESHKTTTEETVKNVQNPEENVSEPKSTEQESPPDTLTYMVNPVTGVGSWGGERKWKPKRKRPNTPSVYSYKNATLKKSGASRKSQRDIPNRSQQAYVAGLMNRLKQAESGMGEEQIHHDYNDETTKARSTSMRVAITAVPITSIKANKPPPKYILEPDKRRYYYAKV